MFEPESATSLNVVSLEVCKIQSGAVSVTGFALKSASWIETFGKHCF